MLRLVPSTQKYSRGSGYFAVVWLASDSGHKKQVFRSTVLFPTREKALEQSKRLSEDEAFVSSVAHLTG